MLKAGDRIRVLSRSSELCDLCPPIGYEGVIVRADVPYYLIDGYEHWIRDERLELIDNKPMPLPG